MYDGQWYAPLREALSAFVTSTQEHVTGTVRLKLYKGNMINAGVWSPYPLYDDAIAAFAGDVEHRDGTALLRLVIELEDQELGKRLALLG